MSYKVQQSVCSDCVTYVKSRIKFNTFNTFNNVTFSEDEEKKIKSLPLILRLAIDMIVVVIKKILNNECNEEEVADTIATLNANADGRYANEDLVNYDQAAKILGVSVTNRLRLKSLLDANGIKQVVMHNQRIGFKRSEVMALRTKLYSKRSK